MNFDETGTLTVRAYTAGGALPLGESKIRITGADEENRFYVADLVTDEDGMSAKIVLPAPSRIYSLAPGAPEIPYATYDIEITSPGYYTKNLYGVSIFSGINSVQPIAMIPIASDGAILYPRDNLEIYIKENERLE